MIVILFIFLSLSRFLEPNLENHFPNIHLKTRVFLYLNSQSFPSSKKSHSFLPKHRFVCLLASGFNNLRFKWSLIYLFIFFISTFVYSQFCIFWHLFILTFVYMYAYIFVRSYIHEFMYPSMHLYIHSYIDAFIHSSIRSYIFRNDS